MAQRFNLTLGNKRLIALDIYNNIEVASNLFKGFFNAVCATMVLGRGHHGLASEFCNLIIYTLIVGCNVDRIQHFDRLFIYMLNDRLTCQQRQRLARKAR